MEKFCYLLLLGIAVSCTSQNTEDLSTDKPIIPDYLPFQESTLTDLSDFAPTSENWIIGGGAYSDLNTKHHLESIDGSGVLLNLMTDENKKHIFSSFDHQDIDLEIDVMMPKGSNSGIYFQSRYEIQLLDSWGVQEPTFTDIGGIYQRWDNTKPKDERGWGGVNPKINAAYAPGLWQNLKISFKSPEFDDNGIKTKNARFEYVKLNGHTIHENIEVEGPTRAAAFGDEVDKAPFMIQGDHGPVAFKNIKYKLYDKSKVGVSNLQVAEYESKEDSIGDYKSQQAKYKQATDSISYMTSSVPQEFMLVYEGNLNFPKSGEYLLDFGIEDRTAGQLILGDSILLGIKKGSGGKQRCTINIDKGSYPFSLIYNHPQKIWAYSSLFTLFIEGPGICKMPIHAPSSRLRINQNYTPLLISAENEVKIQRGFMMHDNKKLTHTISVGTPKGIHYSIDLLTGSLVRMWAGRFMDATDMWHSRGERQLGESMDGPKVELSRSVLFDELLNTSEKWQDIDNSDLDFKSSGYELDESGLPTFTYSTKGLKIMDKTDALKDTRGLVRNISISGKEDDMWCKVAEGSNISLLPNGLYAIDNKKYYIDLKNASDLKAKIRESNNKQELIIPVLKESMLIDYTIIW
ncbi:MAG: DUF1080 domain-containing protein [Reichenbachiella sp.]